MREFLNDIGLFLIIFLGLFFLVVALTTYIINKISKNKKVIIINDYENVEDAFIKAYLEKNTNMKITEKTITMTISGDDEITTAESNSYTDYTEEIDEYFEEEKMNDEVIEKQRKELINNIKKRIKESQGNKY